MLVFSWLGLIRPKTAQILKYFAQSCDCSIEAFRHFGSLQGSLAYSLRSCQGVVEAVKACWIFPIFTKIFFCFWPHLLNELDEVAPLITDPPLPSFTTLSNKKVTCDK